MKIKPSSYLKKLTCLYVEDDLSIQEPFSMLLRHYFAKVVVAKNGQEGFECYQNNLPDIIISDIRMPVMNGIEMVAKIKNVDPDALVIFTTAFSDTDNLKEAIDLGVDGYITKPVQKQQLLKKLNTLAGYLRHRKEIAEYIKLLQLVLDKQPQPIVVLENKEIKLKNKAFEHLFNGIDNVETLFPLIPLRLEEGVQKIHVQKGEDRFIYEVLVQKIEHDLIFITMNDITEYEEEIFTDQLTKVYNRKVLKNLMIEFFDTEIFVALLDIDNFKSVNDTFGHLVGDEVLKEIASVLKHSLRREDKVIRWGGEEFLILFDGISSIDIALKKAEQLREKIEKTHFPKVENVTCSFGVCSKKVQNEEDFTALIEKADIALYKAKKTGKNKVELCEH